MPIVSRSLPTLVAALSVALGACSKDAPTVVAPPTQALHLTIAPDGGRTAASMTASVSRVWPTIALRSKFPASGALVGGAEHVAASTFNSPYDLTTFGGPVLTGGTNWAVYVNCDGTAVACWGSGVLAPSDFLRDLNHSRIISVLDQYVGSHAAGAWAVDSVGITDPNIPDNDNVLTVNELINILFAAAQATGKSGYTNVYHIFLPQGVDMCKGQGDCYSPDSPQNFVFCAFHGSVTFIGGTHIIFSVEPYQGVDGCQDPISLPHGVIDATSSTLSHEFFEAASDPDLSAWFNVLTGNEMADLCFVFFNNEAAGSHHYQIQSEYSNKEHGCTDHQAFPLGN
jgi:hypothetical protein